MKRSFISAHENKKYRGSLSKKVLKQIYYKRILQENQINLHKTYLFYDWKCHVRWSWLFDYNFSLSAFHIPCNVSRFLYYLSASAWVKNHHFLKNAICQAFQNPQALTSNRVSSSTSDIRSFCVKLLSSDCEELI